MAMESIVTPETIVPTFLVVRGTAASVTTSSSPSSEVYALRRLKNAETAELYG